MNYEEINEWFERQLDAQPGNRHVRYTYAMCLYEQGKDTEAGMQHWLSVNNKWPLGLENQLWVWGMPPKSDLPNDLLRILPINTDNLAFYPTRREAEAALAQALKEIRS